MTQFSGQSSWFTPAGYRGIIHILITGDKDLVNQVRTLEAAYEEQQNRKRAAPRRLRLKGGAGEEGACHPGDD